ncbi:MAG: ExbD/TolR family protein [Bacteriovoracaceae bacterium]
MRMKRSMKKIEKLNLIPILDAVFIFIFFLLMSAQFLEVYEIGSDAPAVKMVEKDNKDKKDPLNLTLEISKKEIKVLTGLNSRTVASVAFSKDANSYDLDKLKKVLVDIKVKNSEEESIILRPKANVPYKSIVKIMDTARKLERSETELVIENKNGTKVKTRKLFEQIVFETLI